MTNHRKLFFTGLSIFLIFTLFGCKSSSVEEIVEEKADRFVNAIIDYSLCNEDIQNEFDQRIEEYMASYEGEKGEGTLIAIADEEIWPEFFEDRDQTFSEIVTSDCYEKLIRNRVFEDPSYFSDNYQIQIENIQKYENSISVQCSIIYSTHTKKMIFTFIEADNDYFISGVKQY